MDLSRMRNSLIILPSPLSNYKDSWWKFWCFQQVCVDKCLKSMSCFQKWCAPKWLSWWFKNSGTGTLLQRIIAAFVVPNLKLCLTEWNKFPKEYFNVLILRLSPIKLYSRVYCKRSDFGCVWLLPLSICILSCARIIDKTELELATLTLSQSYGLDGWTGSQSKACLYVWPPLPISMMTI